jgi:hypothetical protein
MNANLFIDQVPAFPHAIIPNVLGIGTKVADNVKAAAE